MTPDEIEFCLRDFCATHKIPPTVLIAGDSAYARISGFCAGDQITGEVFFSGVKVLRDPLIKGIVVSS